MRQLSEYLVQEFGEKVYRLSLSSGCTCPNRDGKIGVGGCSFCSEGGSGEFAAPFEGITPESLEKQMSLAKEKIRSKTRARRFIAYFQSFTNTYGDPTRLEPLYQRALEQEDVVTLSLGTRPDCLEPEILAMLGRLQTVKPVWVELGLQTIHADSAQRIHRGYELPVFEKAYRDLSELGIPVIVHVIFGLPGESREDMLDTVRYLAKLQPVLFGVKLQNLQILKGTELGEEYLRQPFPVMELEEYADLICKCEEILPRKTVLHRMTGDGPRKLLIAPLWSLNKKNVLNTINRKLAQKCKALQSPE